MDLTPEQEDYVLDLFSDKLWRLNNLYKIKDKKGKEIPFVLNQEQLDFHKNKHNKNVILKARQLGFTTYQCISFLDEICFNANLSLGIVAHKLEDAEEFFNDKIMFAFENIDPEVKERFGITSVTDREGKLELSNGSYVRVSTSFRSGTLQKLHVSEYGKLSAEFPKRAKEIRTGAFNAVDASMEITVESTAEGMEGEFYNLWGRAEGNYGKKLTEMDFKPFFYPWWQREAYSMDPAGVEIPGKFTEYFDMLKKDHGIELTDGQKAWYVKKHEEQGDEMAQEFPSFPEEAFVVSGRPVFDREIIAAAIKAAKATRYRQGRFNSEGVFVDDKAGPVKLYNSPVNGRGYANGGDVAEGLEEGDFSTQFVINKDFEQVASYHDHIHPKLFGVEMIHMGNFFNGALLAPEVNNHGLTTITKITDDHYPAIYTREVYDERSKQFVKKVGWQTNGKTKPYMLDELIEAVEGKGDYKECPLRIYDVSTLREMLSLKYEPDGSVNLNGKDRVVAAAISIQAIKQVHETKLGAFDTTGLGRRKNEGSLEWMNSLGDGEESYFE